MSSRLVGDSLSQAEAVSPLSSHVTTPPALLFDVFGGYSDSVWRSSFVVVFGRGFPVCGLNDVDVLSGRSTISTRQANGR